MKSLKDQCSDAGILWMLKCSDALLLKFPDAQIPCSVDSKLDILRRLEFNLCDDSVIEDKASG